MVLNAALVMMDTGHSGNIPFSAVLKAVLLPMNKAELMKAASCLKSICQ